MNYFTRKVGLLQYLYLRFQTSMKCSNCVRKVPKHGSELHILLPWVTVTVHWVSWLPACIVCLHILSTVLNYHYTFHLSNSRSSYHQAENIKRKMENKELLTRVSSLDFESKTALYPIWIEALASCLSLSSLSWSRKYSFTQAATFLLSEFFLVSFDNCYKL